MIYSKIFDTHFNSVPKLLLLGLTGFISSTVAITQPVFAIAASETGPIGAALASLAARIACREAGGSANVCDIVGVAADPISTEGISSLSMSMKYDPSQFTFRQDLSGPLCVFAIGGDCTPASASVGEFPATFVDINNMKAGTALSNSTLAFTDDNTNGIVTVSYNLANPITTGGSDVNFMQFAFEAKQAFEPGKTYIKYFNQPNNYMFTQTNFQCNVVQPQPPNVPLSCTSNTPINGFNITAVPEPLTILGAATAVGFGTKFKKRLAKDQKGKKDVD
jgi:hypothetical protein